VWEDVSNISSSHTNKVQVSSAVLDVDRVTRPRQQSMLDLEARENNGGDDDDDDEEEDQMDIDEATTPTKKVSLNSSPRVLAHSIYRCYIQSKDRNIQDVQIVLPALNEIHPNDIGIKRLVT